MLAKKFCINKPGFQGVNVGISNLFPSEKAQLHDVISLKIEQLFN